MRAHTHTHTHGGTPSSYHSTLVSEDPFEDLLSANVQIACRHPSHTRGIVVTPAATRRLFRFASFILLHRHHRVRILIPKSDVAADK